MRATKGSENVFVDCGFPPAEAENLRIRAKMMMALTGYIQERKITQSRAARIMGVSQPRISDLVRGKIGLFTIDTLVNMVTAAGLKVDVDITAGRPKANLLALRFRPDRRWSESGCRHHGWQAESEEQAGCLIRGPNPVPKSEPIPPSRHAP